MNVSEQRRYLWVLLEEYDTLKRKMKQLQIAAQVARLEENDDDVSWFEQEYVSTFGRCQKVRRAIWVTLG